ncbi:MAG TPA: presqualene diphosphate synthase HpnD [Casimicrobiaceae bacterium]|nr:presqualene diphosphate synthase HpnD [Casimicrobiaceae bacterium]
MTPDEYCQQKTAKSGSSFYYSFLFLPPERRRAITALYAFCREVDDVVDEATDATLARTKLAWWRTEVSAAFTGAPQHPVALALKPVVAQFRLPEEHFQTVIDGMAMDLERNRYLDFAELERYCHCVAGVVGLMSAEIFGYTNLATRRYARDLGIAFQLTNIIRDVGEDARRGRIYLPQNELAAHGVTAAAILKGEASGALVSLMKDQVARARRWYAQAFDALPSEDRAAQRPGIIMASIYRTLLDEIERDGYRVLDRRVALTPLRKLWIAWNTARRG